ncbi:MAG: hypothetical protein Q9191_005558 [Dirinaria sp. TL-2023a]
MGVPIVRADRRVAIVSSVVLPTAMVGELPQGSLGAGQDLEKSNDDSPGYPAVVQQAWNNMQKFHDCVVLTRVGNFYELYLNQADKYGPLLNLKVAKKKTTAGPVSMAGFPFFQLDRFLKILVQEFNESVAISEEFANNASGKVKSGGLLFDRRITRIITPGTLIDEKFMNPYENNYLLALSPLANVDSSCQSTANFETDAKSATTAPGQLLSSLRVGLAWLDLSTGDFYTQTIVAGSLPSALARISPREVVIDKYLDVSLYESLVHMFEQQRQLITCHGVQHKYLSIAEWSPMLESAVAAETQVTFTAEEVAAGGLLLSYVKEKLQGAGMKLQSPVRKQTNDVMIIEARLDLVSRLFADRAFKADMTALLRRTHDSQRIVQKFSMGRGDADDLVALLRSIEATDEIVSVISQNIPRHVRDPTSPDVLPDTAFSQLRSRISLERPIALAKFIADAIDEDGLTQSHNLEESDTANMVTLAQNVLQSEGTDEDKNALTGVTRAKARNQDVLEEGAEEADTWIMRKTASPILAALHEKLSDLYQERARLTIKLRTQFGASSLTLRWAPGLGHFCHIKGARDVRTSLKTPVNTRDVKASKSTRSFHHGDWNHLGGQIDQARLRIKAEEQKVFQALREQVVINLVQLRRNAAVLDELDVACSFATLAVEQGLVRPVVTEKPSHRIIGGRHPTVTIGLEEEGRAFVSNDCSIGEDERIWLITGPNMGGKSTFLRQNALISILAQVGSFVPADYAEIGLVDQIFTRIGSADDLFRDQSTFMVEMLETAAILNQATARSFVVMDEIGRGTTPEDGLAIGFACLHQLYHRNRCRTLFATHFHAIADMSRDFEHLGCYCTDVEQDLSGAFSYVHRLRRGVNRRSHALKVARLAGVPKATIEVAHKVLESLHQQPLTPFEDVQPRAAAA